MKALVTGANGHIGSHLVRALAERGYRVRASVRSLDDRARNADLAALPDVELVELDIRDADRFRHAHRDPAAMNSAEKTIEIVRLSGHRRRVEGRGC